MNMSWIQERGGGDLTAMDIGKYEIDWDLLDRDWTDPEISGEGPLIHRLIPFLPL